MAITVGRCLEGIGTGECRRGPEGPNREGEESKEREERREGRLDKGAEDENIWVDGE